VFDDFYKAKQLTAVVGYTDISTNERRESCKKKTNDVALLKTIKQLVWTSELRPACLPQAISPDYSGRAAIVAGWGFTNENREIGTRPNVLQKTDVIVVNNNECNDWYKSKGSKINVVGTQMCAGYETGGRDSCWADSGGPLMLKGDKGHTMVIGVVSTGSGCARARMPGIYTRVSRFTEWIQQSVTDTRSVRWFPRRV
ncbi:unnamed protein product, partial [Leptidea sinapis]